MQAEYMNDTGDLLVVNAAKVSFNKRSDWIVKEYSPAKNIRNITFRTLADKDKRLINFLARGTSEQEWKDAINDIIVSKSEVDVETHVVNLVQMAKHWAPFAHPTITLRMSAPTPIRTQLFKHKVGFVESEESRRYISATPVLYIPDSFRMKAENKKQGSSGTHLYSDELLKYYEAQGKEAIKSYQFLLDEGVCEEQARFILPQGVEVNWIWTGTLASYARFYNQRSDIHAQYETQTLAEQVGNLIEPMFPVSWKALTTSGRVFDGEHEIV